MGRLRNGGYDLHLENQERYYAEIAVAEIERDRWGALAVFADRQEGQVLTLPVHLPQQMEGFKITLNATGVDGCLRHFTRPLSPVGPKAFSVAIKAIRTATFYRGLVINPCRSIPRGGR